MTVADDLATLRAAITRVRDGVVIVGRGDDREVDAALDRVEAEIARLQRHPDAWSQQAFDQQKARADALAGEVARLRDGLRPIVREYDLWSEDANDGEFRLWDLDRLVAAIVAARALLAEDGATPQDIPTGCANDPEFCQCDEHAEDGAA